MPAAPQPVYLLGLIARAQNRAADAAAFFRRALQVEPGDPGAEIGLGQALLQMRDAAGAVTAFTAALQAEPYNATAAYNLSISLSRAGRADDARQALVRFQALRESGSATTFGNAYLEQGRLAEALVSTGLEGDLVRPDAPNVRFVERCRTRSRTAPRRPRRDGVSACGA